MPGARRTRGPCAKCSKHTVVTTGTPDTRHSLRNGLNGLCHALPGDEFVLPPSSADSRCSEARSGSCTSADLAPATGARTTWFCRTQQPPPIHARPCAAERILAEALKRRSSARRLIAHGKPALRKPVPAPAAAASTASRPASVTIASRPSVGRDGRNKEVIWVKREAEIFS